MRETLIADARAAHSEHQRQELMRQRNFIATKAIIGHEQPPRQPRMRFQSNIGPVKFRLHAMPEKETAAAQAAASQEVH